MPPGTPDDLPSEGGWSDPGPPSGGPPVAHAPGTPGAGDGSAVPSTDTFTGNEAESGRAERYAVGALLGRGGMGVVHAARDRALGRDVALKEVQPAWAGNATARARLAREAAITSRLDHPGIVAVHDAGTRADGRPFYTMRLVRGRTLARAVADATSPDARRQLVRHLLNAADAVAAAHDAGIVHRDLKPANILIGAHGETQVVDWGLATPTAAAAARWADLPAVQTHGPVGTTAFMAPEQARGEPPDPRHDVWSLGITLSELFGGPARLGLPAEIGAIVARATAADPSLRYPDAGEFAEDLLRWFEGRRVAAHVYTPGEFLRRTVAAYRLPIAVGAAGSLAVAAAVGVGWAQTQRSLERALAAESGAAESLADLQLERAVEATRAGDREQAERLALTVLQRREDPLARGVFAAFGRAERPALVSDRPGFKCDWSFVADAEDVYCGTASGVSLIRSGKETWSIPRRADGGALVGGDLLVWDGSGGTARLDPATGAWQAEVPLSGTDWTPQVPPRHQWVDGAVFPLAETPHSPCFDSMRVAAVSPSGAVAGVCGDGTLLIGRVDGGALLQVPSDLRGDHDASSLTWTPDGRLVAGSLRGRVEVLDGTTGAVIASGMTALGAINTLVVSPDSRLVAIGGTSGGVGLWRIDGASLVGEVPAERPRAFSFVPDGLLVHDGRLRTWRVPQGSPALIRSSAGIADVAVSPDGATIAAGGGAGTVLTASLTDCRIQRTVLGDRVVKAVSYAPGDGTLYASGMDEPFLAALGPDGWHRFTGARALRRFAVRADGSVLGLDLSIGLFRWSTPASTPELRVPDRAFGDLERDGDTLVTLDDDGAIERLDGTLATTLRTDPDARAVALRGRRLAVAHAGDVELWEGDQRRWTLAAAGASLLDVALSPDGTRVAAAGMDGLVRVWDADTGALLVVLPGHTERVVSVEFLPDGDLASGSWDKTVRIWELSELARPASVLAEDVAAAWGTAPAR